ncbi:DUF2905 domain-containing protein [Chengkuizengella axinellae]|uniref:DUF2905 domain-containing protein n=1 Tax=Chengkuizengella axinellae TaxID=3064388 RepID=A0ABT9IXJ2_9BACL|nr:DUF2905 domain-containing protein [Chengkuizengella sp. 2205SS18-9]MDP5274090.1 DUF2905 domain-containing protein [Chengkuizengella sp. 2205SS18-9]
MNPVAKMLIAAGAILILIGIVWQFGGRFLQLGKLPGDIAIEKENFKFYFPITTCIVLSVVLSLIYYVIRFFK